MKFLVCAWLVAFVCVLAGCAGTPAQAQCWGPQCRPLCRPQPVAPRVRQSADPPPKSACGGPKATQSPVWSTVPQRADSQEKLRTELREHAAGEVEKLRPRLHAQLTDVLHQQLAARDFDLGEKLKALAVNHEQLAGHVGELAPKVARGLASHPEIAAKVAALAADVAGASTMAKFGAIGGPAGAAIAFGAGLLFRVGRRVVKKKRAGQSTAGTPSVEGPADEPAKPLVVATHVPPPPQQVVHTTKYVAVESDRTSEALAWAKREMRDLEPAARNTIERVEALMKQYLVATPKPE